MDRISITEAGQNFTELVNRVYTEGLALELAEGDKVVARLMPAAPRSLLKVGQLNAFLQGLPKLEDDVESFLDDLRQIRHGFPAEEDPWA